jgi:hypothetical protein
VLSIIARSVCKAGGDLSGSVGASSGYVAGCVEGVATVGKLAYGIDVRLEENMPRLSADRAFTRAEPSD